MNAWKVQGQKIACNVQYFILYNVHVLGISFYKFSYGILEYTGAYLKW